MGMSASEASRRWRERHPERSRAAQEASQNGECAICHVRPSGYGVKGFLVLDHDHGLANEQEALRGLLCWNRNVMLGHARDDVSILKAAVEYLGG